MQLKYFWMKIGVITLELIQKSRQTDRERERERKRERDRQTDNKGDGAAYLISFLYTSVIPSV